MKQTHKKDQWLPEAGPRAGGLDKSDQQVQTSVISTGDVMHNMTIVIITVWYRGKLSKE